MARLFRNERNSLLSQDKEVIIFYKNKNNNLLEKIDMSEELKQKDLIKHGLRVGNFEFYNIGATTLNQLKKYKIVPDRDYKKYGSRKPDALFVDRNNKAKPVVYLIVEHKDFSQFQSEEDIVATIQQCNDVAQEVGAKIGIATDGDKFVWFNPQHPSSTNEYVDKTTGKKRSYTIIKDETGKVIEKDFVIDQKIDEILVDNLTDRTRETYLLVNSLVGVLSKQSSTISPPKSINPLPLAKNVWQAIWIATGKTPEKCLYNVVEILIFKFLSDLEVLNEPENFEFLLGLYDKGKKDGEVLDYYARVCRAKIYELFPHSTTDGTTVINGTIFVDEKGKANLSQAVLFKDSIKKFKEFENQFGKLRNIDREFKTKLYETFLKQTQGLKGLGQYFTPRKVVRAIVNMSGIEKLSKGQRVCDPFCGVGGFVLEPMNLFDNLRLGYTPIKGKILPQVEFLGFDKGAEKDEERTIILAKANMLIYLSDILVANSHLTKTFSEIINETFRLINTNLGTLGITPRDENEKFDLILTNPPYVTKGKKTLSNEINDKATLKDFYKINSIGVEGLALEWIIRNLKKGGTAFVILPDGLLNRIQDKKMRDFILKECYLNCVISLPKKAFFATTKKTYIVSITKKNDVSHKQQDPVFTYLIKDIGERLDITRFEIPDNDLVEVVSLFNQFKGAKQSFSTEKPKCKIQPVKRFYEEKSWIIDRWWTDIEKEVLGIQEPVEVLSLSDFKDKITDMALELKEALSEISKIEKTGKITFVDKELQEIFDLNINTNSSSFTRTFVNENKGEIPVYSASKDPDFIGYGRVRDKMSGVKYFENCLTWNIDGYIGKAFFRTARFSLSEKVIPLILKKEFLTNIDYMYVKYVLEKEAKKRELNFSNKAGKSRIADIRIKLPVYKGSFDLKKQKELAEKYKKIEDIREQIAAGMKSFDELSVEI